MEKIKLLALDMDGTTLKEDKTISELDYKAIQKAHNQGILIVPSSGRSLQGIPEEIISLPIRYAITKNGSLINDVIENKELYREEISWQRAVSVLHFLEQQPAFVSIDIAGKHICGRKHLAELSEVYKNLFYRPENLVDSLVDYVKEQQCNLEKIGMFVLDDTTRQNVLFAQKEFLDLNIMQTSPITIEINNRMASKGNALKWLVNYLGMTKENVAAIGDSDNDLIMLCYAGLSFAMTNGTRYARETADEITLSNEENGVAFAIDKILLHNANC